jgi:hypothetical protein
MTQRRRHTQKPEVRVWVFSEPNPHMDPREVAKVLTRAGLEAAERARRTSREEERDA